MSTLAIDIGGTKIRAGLVENDAVLASHSVPTPAKEGAAKVIERIVDLLEAFPGYDRIGVAAAGVIKDGVVISATDLLVGWTGTDIRGALAEASGKPVTVIGDVHAHGLGEAYCGAGASFPSSLTVAVGTGIGGAYVEGTTPHVGINGLAGHIGHMSATAATGLHCSCGRTGHIEPFASGSGVMARYLEATGTALNGREIDDLAEQGDETAIEILHGSARALGEVLADAANILDPAVIIASGSMTRSGQGWWDALRAGYDANAMDLARKVRIIPGELGDHAPLIGAAVAGRMNRD